MNRPASIGLEERERQKILGNVNWLKKKGQVATRGGGMKSMRSGRARKDVRKMDEKVEGIIFVPCTPNGALAKRLQKVEDAFSRMMGIPRVKMVEKGGVKLSQKLIKKDPWTKTACGRSKCLPCSNSKEEKHGKCNKENITYRIGCKGCKEGGVTACYIGESSRTMFQRAHEESREQRR